MGVNDRLSPLDGGILPIKGVRGSWGYSKRGYLTKKITKPPRQHAEPRPYGLDPLEQRAAGVVGSILERIIYKRLATIWGRDGIDFIYKYQIGAAAGVKNARAFVGGIEMDFVVLQRPSYKELDLEVQGAHWHNPQSLFSDQERALLILGSGRDYAEIYEYEILMGDEYLDARLLQLIGAPGLDRVPQGRVGEEVREIQPLERPNILGYG